MGTCTGLGQEVQEELPNAFQKSEMWRSVGDFSPGDLQLQKHQKTSTYRPIHWASPTSFFVYRYQDSDSEVQEVEV